MRKLIALLGIPLDLLNLHQAIDRMDELVQRGRARGQGHQVATVNIDFLVKARSDPELRLILQECDLATIDGMPLLWGVRWLGASLDDRAAGSDFVPALAERAAQRGYSIYLLGAEPGIAQQAAQILQSRYPGLIVAGYHSPPFQPLLEMDRSILAKIKAANPDILFVAFGNPKQEKWIRMHGLELGVPLMIGVGGTLNFITGNTRRAPRWLQRLGLEWVHRLAQEPRRLWKRYAVDLWVFNTQFARQWLLLRARRADRRKPASVELTWQKELPVLQLEGFLGAAQYDKIWEAGSRALAGSTDLVIDLGNCQRLDSSVLGALAGLAKQAQDLDRQAILIAVPQKIRRILARAQLADLFLIADDWEQARAARPVGAGSQPGDRQPRAGVAVEVSGWLLIQAPRRLETKSAPAFEQVCLAALQDHAHLILNLAETVALTSAGLSALLELSRQARQRQGEVKLIVSRQEMIRVFRSAQVDEQFSIYCDLASVLAHVSTKN